MDTLGTRIQIARTPSGAGRKRWRGKAIRTVSEPTARRFSAAASRYSAVAAAWAALAALVLLGLTLRNRGLSLDGDFQGWGSASCLLMARAFNQLGAMHLHFVPLQNNLPLGRDPDVYLHWPPLYPLVLAWCLRPGHDAVFTGRLLAYVINLLSGLLVAAIGARLYSARVGWWAAFFFFTSKAVFLGNAALLQQPLAMLFALSAVYCFLRTARRAEDRVLRGATPFFVFAGLCSTALMVFAAWDPIFLPFGLLATAMFLREPRAVRLALGYCATAVAAFAAVELDYVLSYPKLFANQFATVAYRAGLHFHPDTSMRLQTYVDAAVYDGQYGIVAGSWRALRFAAQYLSPLSLVLLVFFVALWWQEGGRRRNASEQVRPATWLLGGLLLPAVAWYVVMRNYVAVHPFPLILFMPAVAVASGFLLDRLWLWSRESERQKPMQWALVTVVPLLLLLPLLIQQRDAPERQPQEFHDLAAVIRNNTPPTAVVLTPSESLVPTFYSERHIVRGVVTAAWLTQAIGQAHTGFPGAPLFLAVRDGEPGQLTPRDMPRTPVARQGDATLYRLP